MADGRRKWAVWDPLVVLPITAANERFMECKQCQKKIKYPSGNTTNTDFINTASESVFKKIARNEKQKQKRFNSFFPSFMSKFNQHF